MAETEYSLKSFHTKIDESNIHSEVDFGAPVGNEKVGLAIFFPITSKVKGYPFETPLPRNLAVKGVVISDQKKV